MTHHGRLLRLLVLLVALSLGAGAEPRSPGAAGQERAKAKPSIVRVIVDYSDGVEKHFTRLKWTAGMTALEAMNLAKASPHGIAFRYTGRGATAFLTQIDDLKNRGGGKENWIYRVNGKLATKGFGVQTLNKGDTVTWRFEKYRPDATE